MSAHEPARRDRNADRDWRTAAALALIVLGGGALRWATFRGFVGSDDRVYTELAHALAGGHYPAFDDATSVFQNRIGLIAPVALAVRWLGTAEWTFVLYPFVVSLASIVLGFHFARALFGPTAGLIAAALLALLPIEMSMSTQLVPDLVATFWANLGVFAVWRALQSERARSALAFGLAAGLCFGVAWLHKVSIAYLAPFVGGVLLVACVRRPRIGAAALAATAATAGAVLLAECGIYAALTGDATYRFASLGRNFEQTQLYWFVEGGRFGWEPGHYREALLQRLFVRGPERIFLSRAYAHLPLAALLVGGLALCARETRLRFCGLWFATLLALFNFGTTSLDYYKPLVLFQRYLYPLVLPSVLLVSGGLVLLRRVELPRFAPALPRLALIAIVCLPVARGVAAGLHRELSRAPANAGVRQVAALVASDQALVTDSRTARDLRFFWGFRRDAQVSAFDDDVEHLPPGTLVFINRERIRLGSELEGTPPPTFWHSLPPDWELVARVDEGELLRVPEMRVPDAAQHRQLGHR